VQEVIDQSLTYTRTLVAQLSPPMLKDFGLPMALRWLAEQMRQRNLEVSLDLDRAMVALPEDHAMLLFQSVRELLMNIVKHADTDHARITTRESSAWLTISITDEGLGFDPKTASTADHDRSGPGFGLFSIRERMFALGGRFDLSSQPGKGTVATLSLPLARPGDDRRNQANINRTTAHPPAVEPTVIAAPRTFHAADDGRPPIRVLIADDHAMVRQGLRGLLAGYADIDVVGEAAQGEEAVNLALRLQPDIVLMDVNMPVMDGIEATRHITEAVPMTRIIGLSVQTAGQVETAIREAGALAFLNKEAAVEDLYNTIHALQTTGAPPNRNQTACASPIPKP
jgi:CheY-like chemotaxis protein